MLKGTLAGHECCRKKEIVNAKWVDASCCGWCRNAKTPVPAVSSTFVSSPEMSPLAHNSILLLQNFIQFSMGKVENHAHSPPLYLSFKNLLC
jgi:hypothetical protein